MQSKYKPLLIIILVQVLTWGIFVSLGTYFHKNLVNDSTSLLEFRLKNGADFNTDSAIIQYLNISTGTILSSVMMVLAGVFSGLFVFLYFLVSKLRILEAELKEIKEKLNV
jgi:hypothetical protein